MSDAILKELNGLRKTYNEQPKVFSAILFGPKGVGKTTSLRTAVKPVLLFSFDPQGPLVLQNEIDKGEVIVVPFEKENPDKPEVFRNFEKEYQRLEKLGIFDAIGTIAIDSITTLSGAIMLQVLKDAGRLAKYPQQNDYPMMMSTLRKTVLKILGAPCHTIFIGHVDQMKDDISGIIQHVPDMVGKLKVQIPLLFSEMYFVESDSDDKGNWQTRFYTRSTKRVSASSRLAAAGTLDAIEPADFKKLLKKAGWSCDDKPLLLGE